MACKFTDYGKIEQFLSLFLKDVEAGSIPNTRTPVNDPHSGWKPFSVASMQFLQIPDVSSVEFNVACYSVRIWLLRLLDQHSRVDGIF